jgi:hypothetical protein
MLRLGCVFVRPVAQRPQFVDEVIDLARRIRRYAP